MFLRTFSIKTEDNNFKKVILQFYLVTIMKLIPGYRKNQIKIDEGLIETIDWFRDQLNLRG